MTPYRTKYVRHLKAVTVLGTEHLAIPLLEGLCAIPRVMPLMGEQLDLAERYAFFEEVTFEVWCADTVARRFQLRVMKDLIYRVLQPKIARNTWPQAIGEIFNLIKYCGKTASADYLRFAINPQVPSEAKAWLLAFCCRAILHRTNDFGLGYDSKDPLVVYNRDPTKGSNRKFIDLLDIYRDIEDYVARIRAHHTVTMYYGDRRYGVNTRKRREILTEVGLGYYSHKRLRNFLYEFIAFRLTDAHHDRDAMESPAKILRFEPVSY